MRSCRWQIEYVHPLCDSSILLHISSGKMYGYGENDDVRLGCGCVTVLFYFGVTVRYDYLMTSNFHEKGHFSNQLENLI